MPDSKRKQRQRRTKNPLDALHETIRELVDRVPGATTEMHENGAYESVLFAVHMPEESDDRAAVDLANQVLGAAEASPLGEEGQWTWMVAIHRGPDVVLDLEPGNLPRVICSVCGCIQGSGGECEDCYSPLPPLRA